MAERQSRTGVEALLARHHLRPRRRLGQHFLVDPNIVGKTVRVAEVGEGSRVLEVGTGTGSLTLALAAAGARVLSYEVDTSLRPLLDEVLMGVNGIEVRFEDALAVDLPSQLEGEGWVMVANLPFNVGTPLLMRLLAEAPQLERFVVMVQQEVAERILAKPGTKEYGFPTVLTRLYGSPRLAFRVPPQVFLPPPKVHSAVILIERIIPHPLVGEALALANRAFGQRRKMLRGSLAEVLAEGERSLVRAGLDPTHRPEALEATDFVRLAVVCADAA